MAISLFRSRRGRLGRIAALTAAAGISVLLAGVARADDDAAAIVKKMSDYVAGLKTISITFDTDVEVVTPVIQKIQFASSGSLDLSRPNRFRASRTGGYADVEALSDGKTFTILGRNLNAYAQAPVQGGSIDDVVAGLRQVGAELPAADLLSANPYQALMHDIIDARHIGRGVINGTECDHLAFRTTETDWQIWIAVGDKPIPCRYVITSKAVAAAPQYTVTVKSWKSDPELPASTFAFAAPPGAALVDFAKLGNIDEVPASAPIGDTP